MKILIILCHVFLFVGCITPCRADVTLVSIDDFTIDITNTAPFGGASVSTTVDNEIDNITFGWNDPTRTPVFKDFYTTAFVTVNSKLFVGTLTWKTGATSEERKQAGGEVICKAVSGGITLKSTTFVISVSSDVTLSPIDAFTVDITNTGAFGGASVSTTSSNEIDNIIFEWNDLTRTPAFKDFYNILFVSVNPQSFVGSLSWKTDTTPEERKQANGEVICKAVSGGITLKSTTFVISVSWKPEPSSLTLEFTGNDIIIGNSLTLRCSSPDKGNPPGLVKWVVDGDIKSGGRYNNDNIVINPVEKTDAGDWKCYYGNDVGMGTESETKNVDVKWPPEPSSLTLEFTGDDIILGSSLTLRCSSPDKGNPPGEIKWGVDGDIKSGGRYNNEDIVINPVEKTDAGAWKCYYRNDVGMGTESETQTVDVKWLPGRSVILVNTQFPKLHDSFTLTCTGDQGSPKGRVAWYLDSLIFTNTTDTTLNISSAAQMHNGDWSCMFYNHLDNGEISDSVRVQVLCLPSLYVEYASYEFNESYVHFNLRLNDESAADTVNVQVCYTPNDEPLCSTASSKLENKELISDVELPEPSDHTLYNVTFIFSHGSRIVSRHGIALRGIAPKGNEKQSNTSTIFAAVFGALWIITAGIAAVVILLYHRRLKEMDVNPPKEKEAEVHYVNVGAETGTDNVTYNTSATEYEDVAREAASIIAHNTENTTYMDLDQNDVQQTRNRPAELTVYQSLN